MKEFFSFFFSESHLTADKRGHEVKVGHDSIHRHENFKKDVEPKFLYDIAIITLPEPVEKYTTTLRPICLPEANEIGIFNFSRSSVLTLINHYHTIPHFDALMIYSYEQHCEKRRNCLYQAISPFLTMFSTLYGTYFSF